MTDRQTIIAADGVCCSYGDFEVLKGVSFKAFKGEVFGLLGTNGAGKTTMVRILCGLLAPSSGHVEVLGLNPRSQGTLLRSRIGVMTENAGHYERLSVLSNLAFFAGIFRCENPRGRAMELLEKVGLAEKASKPVSSLSRGMHQRLALARALVGRPELLFLDEPTSGLDPNAAASVRVLIADFCRGGGSVFLTTHYMQEAEELCAQTAILREGRLVCCGNPPELCRQYLPEEMEIMRGGRTIMAPPGMEQLFAYFSDKKDLG